MIAKDFPVHNMDKLIRKSFDVHPTKTIMRLAWFLAMLERAGKKSVSIRNVRLVMKAYPTDDE